MKKRYCKPEIGFESFELCSDIAKGCYFHVTSQDYGCTITSPGIPTLFWYGTCNDLAQGLATLQKHDKPCYHGPSGKTILFTS
ncbi:hypothetical protein [uncultured Pseudoflavonifractor sp.]|uniref:hypothetical protein n=1 Tax=uncultured Pseudoflavonifractor sp. TaxID=1221379 RepID=UPI0025DB1C2B|nr:hypothetical protein [uncultured Pseudoflavonifractor sp.]